jgi:hypothetical protein
VSWTFLFLLHVDKGAPFKPYMAGPAGEVDAFVSPLGHDVACNCLFMTAPMTEPIGASQILQDGTLGVVKRTNAYTTIAFLICLCRY